LGRSGDSHKFELVAHNVEDVWSGGWHTHFTKRDGTLHAFGFNHDGRCGVGHLNELPTPTEATSMRDKGVIAAANGCFASVLTRDGHTYIAGTTNTISTFARMSGLENAFITNMVSGVYKILSLSQDGKLFISDAMNGNYEAQEVTEFEGKRIVDIGVAGQDSHIILLCE
jgi:hypothetical protein